MTMGRCLNLVVLAGILTFAGGGKVFAQTADELYRDGQSARMEQRFGDAVSLLERARILDPGNADILVQLGFAQLGLGNSGAARQAFERALAIAPSYQDARFGLAQIAFRSGNLAEARRLTEIVLGAQPDYDEAKQLRASIVAAEASKVNPPVRSGATSQSVEGTKPAPSQLEITLVQAQKLRGEARFVEAETLYRDALALSPGNADVLVALGQVAGFQQKFNEAEGFFRAALERAPDYLDASLGLARLALQRGDLAGAKERFEAVLEREPDNIEALVGLGDTYRAGGDDAAARIRYDTALTLEPGSADIQQRLDQPMPRKWRVDIGTEVSALTGGRLPWTDSSIGLSYALQPATTIGGRLRVGTRYGETDTQIEVRVDHAFSEGFSAYGIVAATPDADFLARFSFGGGASWRAHMPGGPLGPLLFTLDGRHDVFHDTSVTTISPAVQYFFLDERLGLQVRWIHSVDADGISANGFAVRAELAATDKLRLLAGYSDAPEISDGSQIATQTVFAGISYDLSDAVTLRANYAHEHRDAFESDTVGLGLAVRF